MRPHTINKVSEIRNTIQPPNYPTIQPPIEPTQLMLIVIVSWVQFRHSIQLNVCRDTQKTQLDATKCNNKNLNTFKTRIELNFK